MFKPYQLASNNYKVIFVGTSRVYVGMKPVYRGFRDDSVYNFGFSSLSLINTEKYLDYIYQTQKPEKVFLGLDLFQFSKKWYSFSPKTFSEERLEWIGLINDVPLIKGFKYLFALKDNLELKDVLQPTFDASNKNCNTSKYFVRGWDKSRGAASGINKKEYYASINSFAKTYSEYEYQDEALLTLNNIKEKAKRNNVQLIVFFNPISVDLHALLNIYGLDEELERVKREVVDCFGIVYDFNFVNECTINRQEFYYDASHYNYKFGELIKEDIAFGKSSMRMHVLSSKDIYLKLKEQKILKKKWVNENKAYLDVLNQKLYRKKVLKLGDMKEYLGF